MLIRSNPEMIERGTQVGCSTGRSHSRQIPDLTISRTGIELGRLRNQGYAKIIPKNFSHRANTPGLARAAAAGASGKLRYLDDRIRVRALLPGSDGRRP